MMKGLIIKDLLNLKKSFSTIIAMVVFYFLFAYQSGDPGILVTMIVLLTTSMGITSMSYDDLVKWDKFALSMPVSRKKLVYSKYILSFILSLSGLIISVAIGAIIIFLNNKVSVFDFLISSYIIFAFAMIFNCIILPLVFKYGVEKSRLMMMAVLAIPTIIGYVLNSIGIKMPTENQLYIILKTLPFILLIIIYISSTISCIIYEKKDF